MVLVVSCPCALVISIPLGYFGGVGRASRKGILVKGSNFLDALNQVKTDAAIETADVVLMTDSPSKVIDAIDVTAKTRNVVWQNIIFAMGVKAAFIILGIFGIATMWKAVFGDMGVALIAAFNAIRILN